VTGIITAVIQKKGFGFIRDEEGHERFFHARNLRTAAGAPASNLFPTLLEGTRVEFTPVQETGGKGNGLRAEAVKVLA
jgi:cold shock CspA family protein